MSASQAAFVVLFYVGCISACYWFGVAVHWIWKRARRPKRWRDQHPWAYQDTHTPPPWRRR